MEKLNPKKILASTLSSFRSFSGGKTSPDLSWSVTVIATLCILVSLGILGVFSYQWALTSDTPTTLASSTKRTISANEIRSLIDFYSARQTRFDALLIAKPNVPSVSSQGGVEIKYESLPVLEDVHVEETASGTSPVAN